MKIDFTQVLCNLSGIPLTMPKESGAGIEEVTLGFVSVAGLLGTYPDEQNLPGAEKFARYELAKKIMGDSNPDLTSENITKIKTLIGKCFTSLTVGAAYDAIEGVAVIDPKVTPIKKAYGLNSGKKKEAEPETTA